MRLDLKISFTREYDARDIEDLLWARAETESKLAQFISAIPGDDNTLDMSGNELYKACPDVLKQVFQSLAKAPHVTSVNLSHNGLSQCRRVPLMVQQAASVMSRFDPIQNPTGKVHLPDIENERYRYLGFALRGLDHTCVTSIDLRGNNLSTFRPDDFVKFLESGLPKNLSALYIDPEDIQHVTPFKLCIAAAFQPALLANKFIEPIIENALTNTEECIDFIRRVNIELLWPSLTPGRRQNLQQLLSIMNPCLVELVRKSSTEIIEDVFVHIISQGWALEPVQNDILSDDMTFILLGLVAQSNRALAYRIITKATLESDDVCTLVQEILKLPVSIISNAKPDPDTLRRLAQAELNKIESRETQAKMASHLRKSSFFKKASAVTGVCAVIAAFQAGNMIDLSFGLLATTNVAFPIALAVGLALLTSYLSYQAYRHEQTSLVLQ